MRNPEFERIKKFLQQQLDEEKLTIHELFAASALISTSQLVAFLKFLDADFQKKAKTPLPSELVEMALDCLYECGQAPRNEFKRLADLLQRVHSERRLDIHSFLLVASTALDAMDDLLSVSAAWCLIMCNCERVARLLDKPDMRFENHGSTIPPNIKEVFEPLFTE